MTVATSEEVQTRARIEWATVPRVNLLPDEIVTERRFRRTLRYLASAVVGCVLLGAAGTAWAQLQVADAQSRLDDAQSTTRRLNREAAKYAEVPKVLAQVEAARAAREKAMATDVLWYRFLDDLANATPSSVALGSVSISINAGTGATTGADPLTPGGLGDVTFTGTAARFPDVATWLTQVAEVHGLDASRLQNATREGGTAAPGTSGGTSDSGTATKVTFSTRVVVTSNALSHRYDRKAG